MFDRRNKLTRNILFYRGSGSVRKRMSNRRNKLTRNILFYRGSGSVRKRMSNRRIKFNGKKCLSGEISSIKTHIKQED
jgi:hypothetical protein